jgi:RHS repeat-associated protein
VVTRYGFAAHDDKPILELDGGSNVVDRALALLGGVVVTRLQAATASTGDTWSYPNLHSDVAATANGSGTKTGSTFTYDPYGQPLAGYAQNAASSFSYGWEGRHQKLSEHQGDIATIEMGARQFVPGLGRFLAVDSVEGGCANDYTFAFGDPVNHPDLNGKSWWNPASWGSGNNNCKSNGHPWLGVAFAAITIVAFAAVTGGVGLALAWAVIGETAMVETAAITSLSAGARLGVVAVASLAGTAAGVSTGRQLCKTGAPHKSLLGAN